MGRWGVLIAILASSSAGCDCYSSTVGDDDDSLAEGDAGAGHDAALEDGAAGQDGGRTDDAGVVGLEPIRLDESGNSFDPRVAMDGEGNGTVVFLDDWGVVAKRWESSAWTDNEQLGGDGDHVRVDFNVSGEGVVAWRSDGWLTVDLWAPGVGWIGPEDIGSSAANTISIAALAIDGAGNIMVSLDGERVQTARYEPATGWTEPALVEPLEIVTGQPDLDANEAGDFVGVWTHVVDIDPPIEPIWWSRASDGWQAPAQIGSHVRTASPRVSVDEAGNALVLWFDAEAGDASTGGAYAAWQPRGEPQGEIEYMGLDDGGFAARDVVAMGDGAAFATWTHDSDLLVLDPCPGTGTGTAAGTTAAAGTGTGAGTGTAAGIGTN